VVREAQWVVREAQWVVREAPWVVREAVRDAQGKWEVEVPASALKGKPLARASQNRRGWPSNWTHGAFAALGPRHRRYAVRLAASVVDRVLGCGCAGQSGAAEGSAE
jgi:hypothetical protein